MRDIKYIVLHCTATQPEAKVESILRYWKEVMKWKSVGYHHLIPADGCTANLSKIELPTNGVAGYNQNSIHISYIGGIDKAGKPKDTRTPEQKQQMEHLVRFYKKMFPNAKIMGHYQFPKVAKACPSFDVPSWLKEIGL